MKAVFLFFRNEPRFAAKGRRQPFHLDFSGMNRASLPKDGATVTLSMVLLEPFISEDYYPKNIIRVSYFREWSS